MPAPPLPFPRLYPILDVDTLVAFGLTAERVLADWLAEGVALWQLRAKTMASGPALDLIDRLGEQSHAARARMIVNDRVDLARLGRADGVHLGQTDLAPADARKLLGVDALVGRSTHTAQQAGAACAAPISYVAIGPVFATSTKANPDPVVGLEGVRAVARLAEPRRLPVVAIGGITLERAPAVIDAGADAVAVITDLMRGAPGARARAFLDAVSRVERRVP